MTHTAKGEIKILKKCTLPLTGAKKVSKIITEMGVMDVTPQGLVLVEYNTDYTIDEIQLATEAKLIISDQIKAMI